ncbi:hypothetical protein EDEG_01617 [Edhazardia aedis USNM 41457]|uniref:Gla domain-containing protein n=1 Tax=Edhazardia aedis (strain USNM 41457) TaxID=1003232 RepID=J9DNI9_EDHAE|nr:hypothetical protein EDEG_01617 [Edhazardia aedis USNM 41457]|eukprot:EJW04095.1 hypothetical protein EDEG_01617 [Edhazardia aedis USNM 41457]
MKSSKCKTSQKMFDNIRLKKINNDYLFICQSKAKKLYRRKRKFIICNNTMINVVRHIFSLLLLQQAFSSNHQQKNKRNCESMNICLKNSYTSDYHSDSAYEESLKSAENLIIPNIQSHQIKSGENIKMDKKIEKTNAQENEFTHLFLEKTHKKNSEFFSKSKKIIDNCQKKDKLKKTKNDANLKNTEDAEHNFLKDSCLPWYLKPKFLKRFDDQVGNPGKMLSTKNKRNKSDPNFDINRQVGQEKLDRVRKIVKNYTSKDFDVVEKHYLLILHEIQSNAFIQYKNSITMNAAHDRLDIISKNMLFFFEDYGKIQADIQKEYEIPTNKIARIQEKELKPEIEHLYNIDMHSYYLKNSSKKAYIFLDEISIESIIRDIMETSNDPFARLSQLSKLQNLIYESHQYFNSVNTLHGDLKKEVKRNCYMIKKMLSYVSKSSSFWVEIMDTIALETECDEFLCDIKEKHNTLSLEDLIDLKEEMIGFVDEIQNVTLFFWEKFFSCVDMKVGCFSSFIDFLIVNRYAKKYNYGNLTFSPHYYVFSTPIENISGCFIFYGYEEIVPIKLFRFFDLLIFDISILINNEKRIDFGILNDEISFNTKDLYHKRNLARIRIARIFKHALKDGFRNHNIKNYLNKKIEVDEIPTILSTNSHCNEDVYSYALTNLQIVVHIFFPKIDNLDINEIKIFIGFP